MARETCDNCDGEGTITISFRGGDGVRMDADDQPCPECNGTGKIDL